MNRLAISIIGSKLTEFLDPVDEAWLYGESVYEKSKLEQKDNLKNSIVTTMIYSQVKSDHITDDASIVTSKLTYIK